MTLVIDPLKWPFWFKYYVFQRCGGGADVPLFQTKSKTRMISAHKRVKALKFGTAVVLVKNNMEQPLPPKTAISRRNLLPFLAIINKFQSSEIKILLIKIILMFSLNTF